MSRRSSHTDEFFTLLRLFSLAWAELYLILGNMFRKVEMELAGTVSVDITFLCFPN